MAAKEDEYGNARKTERARERGRAPSSGSLKGAARYTGGVPYQPFRTGRRRGSGVGQTKDQPFPDPPASWTGTLPEWAIYWAHIVLGRAPFQDFQYIYTVDGSHYYDFYEFQERIALEINGLYWHYEFNRGRAAQDQILKVHTESLGITLIFIDEDDALANPVFYLREALAERDHSRAATGKTI